MEKKKSKSKSKSIIKGNEKLFGIIVAVIVLLCLVVIIVTKGNKKNDDEGKPASGDIVDNKSDFTSKDLKDIYGMSGEDAIEIVKKDFKSDTFEFSYDIDKDSQYIITAKNKITGTVYKYSVDPSSGSYYTID